MVTDLLNCQVMCTRETSEHFLEEGTIRALYLDGSQLMTVVEIDIPDEGQEKDEKDGCLYTIQLDDLRVI